MACLVHGLSPRVPGILGQFECVSRQQAERGLLDSQFKFMGVVGVAKRQAYLHGPQ